MSKSNSSPQYVSGNGASTKIIKSDGSRDFIGVWGYQLRPMNLPMW